jgi:hypothetical protein
MMALLYETVPAFEDIWIETLGDLVRSRMAIDTMMWDTKRSLKLVAARNP